MPRPKQDEPQTIKCTYCGESLTEEEVASPCVDGQDGIICDECHHNHFEFTCCRCENYESTDYQDAIGCLLVIGAEEEEEDAGVLPGIYRIIKHPYYQIELLGADHAYADSLELVTPHLNGADPSPYPAGHLCQDCAERIGRLHPPRVQIVIDPRGMRRG